MTGYGLIDYNLYMPKKCFEEPHCAFGKNAKCRKDSNKTKNDMLQEMINKISATGMNKSKYVGVDSAFRERLREFLETFSKELVYFADLKKNLLVFHARPPRYSHLFTPAKPAPEFPLRRVSEIADVPSYPWQDVVLGMGATDHGQGQVHQGGRGQES
jgi:hypothetical protein